jgi:hypothetical protein
MKAFGFRFHAHLRLKFGKLKRQQILLLAELSDYFSREKSENLFRFQA